MDLNSSIEVLLFKDFALADVRCMHFGNLMLLKKKGKTVVSATTLVGYEGEVLYFTLSCCLDKVFRDTTQSKSTSEDSCSIFKIMGCLKDTLKTTVSYF